MNFRLHPFLILICTKLLFLLVIQSSYAVSIEDFSCILNTLQSEGISSKINVGFIPIDVAVNPITNKVYVTNFGDDTVSVIDGASNSVIGSINVGRSPYGIAINKKTNKIYIANQLDNSVSVIDASDNTPITTVPVESKPIQVDVNPNTNKIYVVNQDSNKVSVIDGNNDTVISSVSVGETPFGIAVNTKTNKIYVANSVSNTLSVIDGTSDTLLKNIESLGEGTYGVTIDEESNKIYAFTLKGEELLGRGFLFKIDGSSDSVIESFIIGSNGSDIAFHPNTKKIYVTHTFNGTIDGYDEKKKQLLCSITEVVSPSGIGINPKTNLIYICNNDLSSVTVVKDGDAKDKDGKEPEKPKDDETKSPILEEMEQGIEDLNEVQNDLKKASKFARPIASKLASLIKRLKSALSLSQEVCESLSGTILNKIESIIPKFESRSCAESLSKKCIPVEIVDDFITRLEEKTELIRSILETDDDLDGVPDVCKK